MQGKKQRERYRRLDRAERAAIQSGLDKGRSCRQMARDLGRSPSTVADEVARNRTVSKGPGKGERVRDAPEDACPKLLSWPRCCNGCRNLPPAGQRTGQHGRLSGRGLHPESR